MFGGDLDEVFRSQDPNVAADRLEAWQQEFNHQVEGFDRVQRAAMGLTATETALNGGVRVTVDVSGQVVDIVTSEELDEVGAEEIGPAVMACIRRARQAIADKFAETASEQLGADPLGAHLAEQFRERFPEPPEPEKPKPKKFTEDGQPVVWEED
jgi:hypothetical protein